MLNRWQVYFRGRGKHPIPQRRGTFEIRGLRRHGIDDSQLPPIHVIGYNPQFVSLAVAYGEQDRFMERNTQGINASSPRNLIFP